MQINSHLKSIYYDRNNITLQGYSDLAYAMERYVAVRFPKYVVYSHSHVFTFEFDYSNYTLRYMPVPTYDIVPCMKISSEKTETIMKKIQDILHRNVSPKRCSNGHAFRLQQVRNDVFQSYNSWIKKIRIYGKYVEKGEQIF